LKRAGGALLTGIDLDPENGEPLYRQLYLALQRGILEGALRPGHRLPSTRTLASELGVSRNTVKIAFEQLLYEGYIEAKVGAGSFVSEIIPDSVLGLPQLRRDGEAGQRKATGERRVSSRGRFFRGWRRDSDPVRPRPFAVGIPSLDAFPVRLWNRLASQRARRAGSELLGYAPAEGYAPLREAIASYLGSARGVRCTPEQVVVVSSSQQALDLAARVLLDAGDEVWLEEPGYLGAQGALRAAGAEIRPVPVDREGLVVEVGKSRAPAARLAYVTPSHQFPLGSVMTLGRRLQLIEWAESAGAWILEDDYDSELRYRGRPIQALQGLDEAGRVIYIGTFTKVLFPGLRLAYLVCPPDLLQPFVTARALQDGHSPLQPQAMAADFLVEGHFATHLRRMRALYLEQQETLRREVEQSLAAWVDLDASPAGMHLVAYLHEGLDDREASLAAARRGVEAVPLSRYYVDAPQEQGLLLGYSGFGVGALRDGVRRLAAALGEAFPIAALGS
jgi:GntR family transcriptional regulator/MocR family aminotransferase